MAKQVQRTGVKNISLELERSAFSSLFHFFSKKDLFGEVSQVRALLSNERARMIHDIKENKPKSVYALAKHLGREFKAVRKDIALLEHFGIVSLHKTGKNRKSLRPVLNLDSLQINIGF